MPENDVIIKEQDKVITDLKLENKDKVIDDLKAELTLLQRSELADKEQDKVIAVLKAELYRVEKNIIELSERRRGWVRMGMISWFCSLITYVVVMYTGNLEGQIKPEIIWSFCTGVLVTKLLDHYINPSTVKDRVS